MLARPLEPADDERLREFVESLPPCHLGLRAASRRETGGRFVGAFEGDALTAVVFVAPGASVVVAGDARGVAEATRLAAPSSGPLRRLVGREAETRACVAAWPGPAPILRRHLHMTARRAAPLDGGAIPRLAGSADLAEMVSLQREFHAADDPPGAAPAEPRSVELAMRARIAAGMTWYLLGGEDGRGAPAWKTDVAVDEPDGALLAGVVTRPSERGRGLATRGLSALVAAVLARGVPRVTLHVAETNAAARAVYERVGFETDDAFLVGYARAPARP